VYFYRVKYGRFIDRANRYAHTVQKDKLITTKMLSKDLTTMERQRLIIGYKYNRDGDPEQHYELAQGGNDKFWAFEFENPGDEDRATLERCRTSVLLL
jgi:hypothetical protein